MTNSPDYKPLPKLRGLATMVLIGAREERLAQLQQAGAPAPAPALARRPAP